MTQGASTKSALRFGSNIEAYPDAINGNVASGEMTLGQYDLVPLLSENISEGINLSGYENINEQEGLSGEEIVGINVKGDIVLQGYYEGLDQLLTAALGSKTTTTLTANEYKHEYSLSRFLSRSDGVVRRFTLGMDKNVSIWIFRACMVNSIRLSYSISDGLEINANVICYDVTRNSTTNTSSDSWGYNPNFKNKKIKGIDATFEIDNTQVKIDGLKLNINNQLEVGETIQSKQYISEPTCNGIRSISGTINFPRYENNDYINDLYSEDTNNLKLTLTGDSMGTNDRKLIIESPFTKMLQPKANINGADGMTKSFDFKSYKGSSLASPINLTTQNHYPYNDIGGR